VYVCQFQDLPVGRQFTRFGFDVLCVKTSPMEYEHLGLRHPVMITGASRVCVNYEGLEGVRECLGIVTATGHVQRREGDQNPPMGDGGENARRAREMGARTRESNSS